MLNIIQHDTAQPATLKLPSPKISEADRKQIQRIADGIDRTEAAMDELNAYSEKNSANAVISGWVEGKQSFSEAILAAGFVALDRRDLIAALRGCAKECARQLRKEGAPFIGAALAFKADAADKEAAKLEAGERKIAETYNVIYTASGTLAGIRKTAAQLRRHSEELSRGGDSINVNDLRELLD
jgi:hypothetical protein